MIWLLLSCAGTPDATKSSADASALLDTGQEVGATSQSDGVPVEWSAEPNSCADPSLRNVRPFDRVEVGFNLAPRIWFSGGGVVAADFNGDGRLDLFLPGVTRSELFLQGADRSFVDASVLLEGLPMRFASGGAAADFDGDGDADLLVTRFLAPDVLLLNDGDGFRDVSEMAGLAREAGRSTVASWADMDGDGDLDLFVGGYGWVDESNSEHETFEPAGRSYLYRNEGREGFVEVGGSLPQSVHDGYTLAGGFHDVDEDGAMDLYVVNDFGMAFPNTLIWNRPEGFVADENAAGLDAAVTGMGLAMGDLNHDQRADFFMPEWNGLNLFLSGGLGQWFNWSKALGLINDIDRDQKVGWGTALVDLDNDGDLDVPVVFGHLESRYNSPEIQPDALYVQDEQGEFSDEAARWGFDDGGMGRGLLAVDMDGDGWLDVVKRELDGPTLVHWARCGEGSWMRVSLRQSGPNPDAIGARIRARAPGVDVSGVVRAGGTSYASAGPPEVHLGLGQTTHIDELRVTWPDGSYSVLVDVDVDQHLVLTRGQR